MDKDKERRGDYIHQRYYSKKLRQQKREMLELVLSCTSLINILAQLNSPSKSGSDFYVQPTNLDVRYKATPDIP